MLSKINDDLSLELKEVRAQGQQLAETLEKHNFLPDDFPKEQIQLIVTALHGLQDGSLEGARLPLEHAAVRLSEIRRRHFSHPETESESDENFSSPVLERGDFLDLKISQLLSAISTALDAYREQARTEYESFNTQEFLEILPNFDAGRSDDSPNSLQVEEFNQLAEDAAGAEWSDSLQLQNVAVSAADAGNSLASARAEAASKFIIRGWIKKLASLSADALNILANSLELLERAGGVAHEFYLRYEGTVSRIQDVVIAEAKEWLSFLTAKLKQAESAVRKYAQDHDEKNYGIIDIMGGQRTIVNHQRMPFAISTKERSIPKLGAMVEFDLDNATFPPKACNVHETDRYLIVDGQILSPTDAVQPLLKKIERMISSRKSTVIPIRQLEKRFNMAKSGFDTPARFWKLLGYNSLTDFIRASGRFFTYPDGENPSYLSVEPVHMEPISVDAVKDWALLELRSEGQPASIGEIALRASKKYSAGRIPVRLQLGLNQFSNIFDGDARFVLSSGMIYITEGV